MRDEASMRFPGNAVEQARAFEAHAQRRQSALTGRYVTIVPSSGFTFRNYDLGERKLILDTERSLVVGDGAELFVPSKELAPGFALPPDLADRTLAQCAAGKIGLRLIFRPAYSQLRKDACMWQGGGRMVKMEIEILGTALVATDGTVLARGDTGEYADSSMANPVRTPKVFVSKPRTADGKELPPGTTEALSQLATHARPCYERALTARPALRGTLVLAIKIGPGGHLETPYVEMSSLGDDAMKACVVANVGKAKIAGVTTGGQRYSVPLVFSSAEDRN
jgi:hypothetical protein